MVPLLTAALFLLPGWGRAQTYLSEGFEGTWSGSGSSAAPAGWTQSNIDLISRSATELNFVKATFSGSWTPSEIGTQTPGAPPEGTSCAAIDQFNFGGSSTGTAGRKLSSGDVDLTSSTNPWVGFSAAYGNSNTLFTVFRAEISSNGGATWQQVQVIPSSGLGTSNAWITYGFAVPAAYRTSQFRVAFTLNPDYQSSDVYLDNVRVAEYSVFNPDATTNTYTGANLGTWHTGSNWSKGTTPTPFEDVVIPAGITVNITTATPRVARCRNLTVNGTLQYGSASGAVMLIVGGDVTVASGGTLNVGTAAAGDRMYFGGSLTNNGTVNAQLSTAAHLVFQGVTAATVSGSGTWSGSGTVSILTLANTAGVTFNQSTALSVRNTLQLAVGAHNPNGLLNFGLAASTTGPLLVKGAGSFTSAPGFPALGTNTFRSYRYSYTTGGTQYQFMFLPPSYITNINTGNEVEVISSTPTFAGGLTLEAGGTVTLTSASKVGTDAGNTATLSMTRGILVTTPTNMLTLNIGCTGATGISPTLAGTLGTGNTHGSYIVGGPVRVLFPATGLTTRNVPLGTGSNAFDNTAIYAGNNTRNALAFSMGGGAWASQDVTVSLDNGATGSVTSPITALLSPVRWRIQRNTSADFDATNFTLTATYSRQTTGGNISSPSATQANVRLAQSSSGNSAWTTRTSTNSGGAFANNTTFTVASVTTAGLRVAPLATNGEYIAIGTLDAPAAVGTVAATTVTTTAVATNSADNAMLRVNIPVSGLIGNQTLTAAAFGGSFNNSDVTNAKLWVGTISGPTTQIGSTITNPNPAGFTFTGLSQALAVGDNYFWVTYSITPLPLGSSVQANLPAGGLTITASNGGAAAGTQPASLINGTARAILLPIAVSPSAPTICNGQSVNLTASSSFGYTYTWSPATGLNTTSGPTVTANPSTTTVYTVTGDDGNGNQITQNVTVTVRPLPVTPLPTSASASVCIGSPVQLSITNDSVYTKTRIGSGTTSIATTPTQPGPFTYYWGGNRTQSLYLASEIGRSGTINSISYFVSDHASGGPTANYANYQVQIRTTSLTALTTSFESGLTTVFSTAALAKPTGNGWYTITFDTPFVYDGTSNLIIQTCFGDGTSGNTNQLTYVSTTPFVSTVVSGGSGTNCSNPATGTTSSSLRPQIILGFAGSVTYSWSPATGLSATNVRNPILTVPSVGANNYTVTVNDGTCNSAVGNLSVTGVALPAAPVVATNPSHCGNQAPKATFTYSGTQLRIYTTATGGTPVETITSPANQMSTYTVGVNGTVLYAANYDGTCESSRTPWTISVDPAPTVTITPNPNTTSVCPDTPFQLTASGPGYINFSWAPATGLSSTTGATVTANINQTITYTVTADDGNGCSNIQTINLNVKPSPSTNWTAVASVSAACVGTDVNLNLTNGSFQIGSGTLSVPSGTTTSDHAAPFTNYYWGQRSQMLIRASELLAAGAKPGVPLRSIAFNILNNAATAATYNNFAIRIAPTALTALTGIASPSFTTVYSNAAYPKPTSTGWHNIPFTSNFVWDGTQNIIVEVCFNNSGYTANMLHEASTTSFVSSAYFRDDIATNCSNSTATGTSSSRVNMIFNAGSAIGSGLTYSWSPATGLSATNIANPVLSVASPGLQTYTLTVTNGDGCSRNYTVDITGTALPSAPTIASNTPHCGVQTPTVTINTPDNGWVLKVYDAATAGTVLQTTTVSTATTAFSGFTMGSGSVWVTLTNNTTGCEGPRTEVVITTTPAPALTATATVGGNPYDQCDPAQNIGAVTLTASGVGYTTYTWSSPGNPNFATGASISVTPASSTVYTVVASDGACINQQTVTVNRPVLPVITSISATSTAVLANQPVTLSAIVKSSHTPSAIGGTGAPFTVGTNSSTASPFMTWYGAAKQTYLIRASELQAAGVRPGLITGMWFAVTSVGSQSTLAGYRVSMQNTTLNDLTSTSYPATAVTDLSQTVFGPVTKTLNANTTDTIKFTSPFNWNGTSNILVQTCFDNNVVGTVNPGTQNVNTSYTSSIISYDDNAGGTFCSGPGTLSFTRLSVRPLFNFTQGPAAGAYSWTGPGGFTASSLTANVNPTVSGLYTLTVNGGACPSPTASIQVDVVACPTPTNIAVSTVRSTSVTITHNVMFSRPNYRARIRPVGSLTWSGDYTGINGTININGLTPATNYEVQVSTVCTAVTNVSPWSSSVAFTTLVGNDEPCSAFPITVNSGTFVTYSNVLASNSATVSEPSCQSNYSRDVFFKFKATSTQASIFANVGTLTRLNIQLYIGTCGSLTNGACLAGTASTNARLAVTGLTIGEEYIFGISSFSGNSGTFSIAVTDGALWTGATSTAAGTASNWFNGILPASGQNVTIPSGLTNYPVYTTSTTLGDLTLENGARLSVTTGTLTVGNVIMRSLSSMALSSACTLAVGGNLGLQGNAITGAGIVSISGTGRTITGSAAIENLHLATSATATQAAGSTITLGSSFLLNGDASYTNNGSLIFNSVIGKTANFRTTGTTTSAATFVGNITTRVWLPTPTPSAVVGRWYNLGLPIKGKTLADMSNMLTMRGIPGTNDPSGNPTVRFYNEPAQAWQAATSGSQPLAPGVGPIVALDQRFFSRAPYWEVTGEPVLGSGDNNSAESDEPFVFSVTNTGDPTTAPTTIGNNLLANPFPGAIDWDAATGWTFTNISPTVIIRDAVANQWVNFNRNTNAGTRLVSGTPSGIIGVGQGFVVQTLAAGPAAVSVDERAKVASTNVNAFRQGSTVAPLTFKFTADGYTGGMDISQLGFVAGTSLNRDGGYDVPKLMANVIDMWMEPTSSLKQSVTYFERPSQQVRIPVNFRSIITGAHTISFTDVANMINENVVISLVDHFTGVTTPILRDMDYSFSTTAAPASKADGRFELVIVPAGPTSLGGATQTQFGVYPNPAEGAAQLNVVLTNLNTNADKATISIMDAVGRAVVQEVVAVNGVMNSWNVRNSLAAGVYTVKVNVGGESYSQKLVVK